VQVSDLMTKTLTLSGEVYRKLARGAAARGMTIESLLAFVSELVVVPDRPTEQDRQRNDRIEKLLDRFRAGQLNAQDGAELDQLIAADYQTANLRADRLIQAKQRPAPGGRATGGKPNSAAPAGKPSRK
jgi:hypothetical protein